MHELFALQFKQILWKHYMGKRQKAPLTCPLGFPYCWMDNSG